MSDDEKEDLVEAGEDAPAEAAVEPAPEWLVAFRRSAFKEGFYQSGDGYGVVFTDRKSDVLVVSFDNLSQARDDSMDRSPWGYGFVGKNGWSQLGVMTFQGDWFRNAALLSYMEELAGSGFFGRFRKVIMTGTSMGGYAACAFSSLAPGCTVLALSPQSTLKKTLVPWEKRFSSGRKADWTGPFSDGAAECVAASKVFLVYDPYFEEDVQHVVRFDSDNVVKLRARYSGHKSALFLRRAGLLSAVVREAIEGDMTASRFYALYRQGRKLPWFLNAVKQQVLLREKPSLVPALASAARKMGFEQIARSAEGQFRQDRVGPRNAPCAPVVDSNADRYHRAGKTLPLDEAKLIWQDVQPDWNKLP